MTINHVTIGPEFFKKTARNDYSYPCKAFIREYLQNSRDANSTEIHFSISEDNKIFSCVDNGIGMTEEIIREKLMRMGETSKGIDSTGGFGVAKALILFSQGKYEIRTQDNIVLGDGPTWQLKKSSEWVQGCHITVELDTDIINLYFEKITEEIKKSYIPNINITVNGETVKANNRTGELVFENDDLCLYRKRNTQAYYANIRVGGLHMFEKYLGESSDEIIIELKGYSVDYLTTNRDGLRWQKASIVEQLTNDYIVNPISFAKNRTELQKFQGDSSRVSPSLKSVIDDLSYKLGTEIDTFRIIQEARIEIEKEVGVEKADKIVKKLENKIELKDLNFSIEDLDIDLENHFYVEKGKGLKVIPKDFHPETMRAKYKRLLELWAKILGFVFKDNGFDSVTFDVGFIIEPETTRDPTLAKFIKKDNRAVFLINPRRYLEEKAIPFSAKRKLECILYLKDCACHEITHWYGKSYHNEDFIAMEGNIKAHTNGNIKEYIRLWDKI